MFKVNNKDIRTISRRHFGVFIVNLKDISHHFLVFTVDFEKLVAG